MGWRSRQALRQSLAAMTPEGRIQGGVGAGAGTDNGFVKYLPTYRATTAEALAGIIPPPRGGRLGGGHPRHTLSNDVPYTPPPLKQIGRAHV